MQIRYVVDTSRPLSLLFIVCFVFKFFSIINETRFHLKTLFMRKK